MQGFVGVTQGDVDALLADGGMARIADLAGAVIGVKQFEPGEVFANHYHESYDELFVGLAGEITVWQGRALASTLVPGSSVSCRRGVHHRLANLRETPARLLFVKTSAVDKDTVWIPWDPNTDGPSTTGRNE